MPDSTPPGGAAGSLRSPRVLNALLTLTVCSLVAAVAILVASVALGFTTPAVFAGVAIVCGITHLAINPRVRRRGGAR